MYETCFFTPKPYQITSWTLNISVYIVRIIIFPAHCYNIFGLWIYNTRFWYWFMKIIARNIKSVKDNNILKSKSVKGSALSLLPEYDIINYYLYLLQKFGLILKIILHIHSQDYNTEQLPLPATNADKVVYKATPIPLPIVVRTP